MSGNFREDDKSPVEKFNALLALYKDIGCGQLRTNMKYFLEAISLYLG